MPERVAKHPNSAPAALPSSSKKIAVAQGEIQIGIEPSLSPLFNIEMDCYESADTAGCSSIAENVTNQKPSPWYATCWRWLQ